MQNHNLKFLNPSLNTPEAKHVMAVIFTPKGAKKRGTPKNAPRFVNTAR